jgi:hypothetical protein
MPENEYDNQKKPANKYQSDIIGLEVDIPEDINNHLSVVRLISRSLHDILYRYTNCDPSN